MQDDASDHPSPRDRIGPLLRVRQIREFTDEPLGDAELHALTEVARWSGSSRNEQPWHFIVIRDRQTIRTIAEAGMPQTRSLHSAVAAVAIVLPDEASREVSRAYDDGRVAERILVAASFLELGAGIAWIRSDVRATVRDLLGLPQDRLVRTVMSLGRASAEAERRRMTPGAARRPREEVVFQERWPADDAAGS
jgi:nitroreductase